MSDEPIRYLRQVIVVRKDLNMPALKIAAMAAHAAMTFICKRLAQYITPDKNGTVGVNGYFSKDEWQWMTELDPGLEDIGQLSFGKVVVYAQDEAELLKVIADARAVGLPCDTVVDSGHSHNKFGTLAAVAIGPCWPEQVKPITGHLKTR